LGRRAAVLIGVDRSGQLPRLEAAAQAARHMERWAESQKFGAIRLITDEREPVHAHRIKSAIRDLVEGADVDQLLVYFSGHGVNIGYNEYWLLSDAPADTSDAVNVAGSEVLARYGTVPHVVIVSDACRTAAEGIRAQGISGSEIFPNLGNGASRAVDLFYATTLGRPAHEIRDPDLSARHFIALYTDVLLDSLEGRHPEVLEAVDEGNEHLGVVRPWPLKNHLPARVLERLKRLGQDLRVAQTPDATITSPPEAWLSRVELRPASRDQTRSIEAPPLSGKDDSLAPIDSGALPAGEGYTPPPLVGEPIHAADERPTIEAFRTSSTEALRSLLGLDPLPLTLFNSTDAERAASRRIYDAVTRQSSESYVPPTEISCGFDVRGTAVARAYSRGARTEVLEGSLVRVDPGERVVDVWLGFAGGRGTALLAIPDFVATVTFNEGELIDVSYDLSKTSPRWDDQAPRQAALRPLRTLIAESAWCGVFHPDADEALVLGSHLRAAGGIDPTTALHAAYAYHQLHLGNLLDEVKAQLRNSLGFLPYDVALLTGGLRGRSPQRGGGIQPSFPLLTQGWGLLRAFGARLPSPLEDLRRHLAPSLWTLFDARGAKRLLAFMKDQG